MIDTDTNSEYFKMYYGYQIHRNGNIVSPNGRVLSPYAFTYPYSHVTLNINGKDLKKNRAILVYNAFAEIPMDNKKEVIKFKDGNYQNAAFDNLYLIKRKDFAKMYCHSCKFTYDEKKAIYDFYMTNKISLRKLAWKYECSLKTIQKAIDEFRNDKMA